MDIALYGSESVAKALDPRIGSALWGGTYAVFTQVIRGAHDVSLPSG